MEDESKSYLINNTTTDIETSFQDLATELNDKIFVFTGKYWKYIYADRFLKIMIMLSSMIAAMILSFEMIDRSYHDLISLCIVYGLVIFNLLCIVSLIFFKVRLKCVYYNTLSKLYSNILVDLKKTLTNPMEGRNCRHEYERIVMNVNTVVQVANSYKMV